LNPHQSGDITRNSAFFSTVILVRALRNTWLQ
jgi:hypothetical protein